MRKSIQKLGSLSNVALLPCLSLTVKIGGIALLLYLLNHVVTTPAWRLADEEVIGVSEFLDHTPGQIFQSLGVEVIHYEGGELHLRSGWTWSKVKFSSSLDSQYRWWRDRRYTLNFEKSTPVLYLESQPIEAIERKALFDAINSDLNRALAGYKELQELTAKERRAPMVWGRVVTSK